jgi:hypothetical protein
MKHIMLATMLATATLLSSGIPSQAASVTVTTTDHHVRPHHGWRPMHRVAKHCYTKTEKIRSHGRVVVKETRVCR